MKMKYIVLPVSLALMFGCSSGVEELAAEGKWDQVGYLDGIKGQPTRSISSLNELGQASRAEYDEGYVKGITEYCNPNFAYQIGLSGQPYYGVCEGTETAQKFRMEWQRGWNASN